MTEPLWTPSAERLARARLGRFMAEVRDRWGVEAADYGALHAWSVAEPAQFWRSLWISPGSSATGRARASRSTATGCREVVGSQMPG